MNKIMRKRRQWDISENEVGERCHDGRRRERETTWGKGRKGLKKLKTCKSLSLFLNPAVGGGLIL